jgi:heavy metal sensor kinase
VRRPGLRFKLTLLYTAILSVLLGAFFLFAYYLLSRQLEQTATEELLERATGLKGYLRFEKDAPVLAFDSGDAEVSFFIRTATRFFQIYDLSTGEVVEQSADSRFLGLEMSSKELSSIAEFPVLTDVETDEGRLRFFNDRLVDSSGRAYVMQVGISLEPAQQALRHFVDLSLVLLPFGILIAATSGWVIASRTLSPIKAITKAAQEIEVSDLSRRLPVAGSGDEVDQLALTFNDAFARLERSVGEMRQFTASIAHELRTPLASLRGAAEFSLLHSQSLDDCKNTMAGQVEEIDKLNLMIRQLLTLARADSGEIPLQRQRFNAAAMLSDLVETFSLVASGKNVALELDVPAEMSVAADRNWLERAIFNLIDNAIKFTPAGGRVKVSGRTENGNVALEVSDNGPGISPAALPHIFERFYRADESRSKEIDGVGLGLSLVKWIVEQHQGRVIVQSQQGQGSSFSIILPDINSI